MNHHDIIQREFAKQASAFGAPGLTLGRQDYLAWMVQALGLPSHARVLDVAAGTGHLSRALAPQVREVIALDTTPEMLAAGQQAAEGAGLSNITFERGVAEALPYPDASYDAVVCRFAVHHFLAPGTPMGEMHRVCKPGGTVAIIDLVTHLSGELAERYNHFERLRDPSHIRALSPRELRDLFTQAGLAIHRVELREVEVEVEGWLDLTKPSEAVRSQLIQALREEIRGGRETGMRPYLLDEQLMFHQTWMIVAGERPR
jgi:ubiquinone/menaquinone biosynthesis C-methylase UbiE